MLCVKGAQRFVEAVIRIAELGRHENVGPAEQRVADAVLVSIHRRRIDQRDSHRRPPA